MQRSLKPVKIGINQGRLTVGLKRLKWVSFTLPAIGLAAFELVRYFVLERWLASPLYHFIGAGVTIVAAIIFTTVIFRVIEAMQRRILEQNRELARLHIRSRKRSEQLAALNEAAITLTSELSMEAVLQQVVDLGRKLVDARYRALVMLDEEGHIDQFVTSGVTPEERARIGSRPKGRGLLGIPIKTGRPVRVADLTRRPDAVGFPPNHPPLKTLLGIPINYKGKTLGGLYIADKEDASEFSQEDEEIMTLFANQAAVAIENTRLYQRVQTLAVLEDRERIGKELHDSVIQSIYAVGLSLESISETLSESPQEARERLDYAIGKLNDTIRDIRNYIFDLRPQIYYGKTLGEGLEDLVAELRVNTLMDVELKVDPLLDCSLPQEQTIDLLKIAREALTNVIKHAQARSVTVEAKAEEGLLVLSIQDDGIGFDPASLRSGVRQGLRNMQERARALEGELEVQSAPGKGTRVVLRMPYTVEEEE
jgi:signal transduction histidine kinase